MPTLAKLASVLTKQLTLFADTGDPEESVTLTYRPGEFTSGAMDEWNALVEQLNAAVTEEEAEAGLLRFGAIFCRIVAGWDLLEADGAAFPLTPARIVAALANPAERQVFVLFMQAVVQAIAEDMGAGKASGTPPLENSGDTSSPTERSASKVASLNRSASSSSRAGSRARQRSNG